MARKRDPQLPGFDKAASPARARGNRGAGCRWRCYTCGELFSYQTGKKGFETHADERRHHRIEVVL